MLDSVSSVEFGPRIASATVPASIANMGSGFDVHSMALEFPRIEIELANASGNVRMIRVAGTYSREIPVDPTVNAAGKALEALRHMFGKPEGYVLTIYSEMPPRVGLGLSGAEAVGAVLCASIAFNLGLSREEITRIAARAEPMQHMDNVAASAFGGFNIVAETPLKEHAEITTIAPPEDLGVVVIIPSVEKPSTEAARKCLPSMISREHYVQSISYASRLTAAFAHNDLNTLLDTLPWDNVVEATRAAAGVYGKGVDSTFLRDEKRILLEEFHVAETISGAGPSRALWYSISEDQKRIREDGVGLVKPAAALVSSRLEGLGHTVKEILPTRPSAKGATGVYYTR